MARNLLHFIRQFAIWNLNLAVLTRPSDHFERPLTPVVVYRLIVVRPSNHPFRVIDQVLALLGIFSNCDLHVIQACSSVAYERRSRILTHLIVENLCLVVLRIPDADAGVLCSQVDANNSRNVTHIQIILYNNDVTHIRVYL